MDLDKTLLQMRSYYRSGVTRSFEYRKQQLKKLKTALVAYEQQLYEALNTDLKKSKEESWVTEIGFVTAEINLALKNLRHWMQPTRVDTTLVNFPSKSFVMPEPLGVVFIIGPWNYPLQLLFTPLVGAIAAGNCILLKPSEHAPATAAVIKSLLKEHFDPQYISAIDGDGAKLVPLAMKDFVFDHIFFTGSTAVGKKIYQMAAENLVPVTLELGGKSPCVVEADANLAIAARRIVVTKFSNAGQMCVAPDYLLVHSSVKEAFIALLKKYITRFFGEDAAQSASYGRIINQPHFDRLTGFLVSQKIIHGGTTNRDQLYVEPTLVDEPALQHPLMQEEIFGPILPILTFNTKEEALVVIQQHPNPLSFYVFTASKANENYWLQQVAFGGGCINNASWHLTNHHLPFGGRGTSGTGKYHGKYSFDTFSHYKSVMRTPTWFDPAIKYPPLTGKLGLFKKVVR